MHHHLDKGDSLAENKDIPNSLFFYGTLKAAEVREAVLGYNVPEIRLAVARLHGHAVRRVAGTFYPMIVSAQSGGFIDGVLMTGIDSQELERLDRLEGVNYRRIEVDVECYGQMRATQVYKPVKNLLAAEQWDFENWYENDLNNFLSQDFNLHWVRRP